MSKADDQTTRKLLERNLITENQYQEISSYRDLNVFSLNAELKLFLYLSVLLFTSGVGVLIYNNIDSIGHIAILSVLLTVAGVCFYFSFKNSKGFHKHETTFENPVVEYLVLAANILTCIFIGYLQFQYQPFGTDYRLATLIPTIVSFFCAYYFDNKNVLTIAITGLAAFVGLSVTPQDLLDGGNFYDDQFLGYTAILLGTLLILWTIYNSKIQLKTHFNFIYLTFALHIISIAAISNMTGYYEHGIWLIFMILLAVSSFYFYKISHKLNAISLYIFMIIYAYVGFTIFLFRIFDEADFSSIWELLILLLPVYIVGLIVLFIKLIKRFNKEIAA